MTIPLKLRLQQFINPSTIVYVRLLYGIEKKIASCNLEYEGYLKLQDGKMSKVFNKKRDTVTVVISYNNGFGSTVNSNKQTMETMIADSLGSKINKEITFISVLGATIV